MIINVFTSIPCDLAIELESMRWWMEMERAKTHELFVDQEDDSCYSAVYSWTSLANITDEFVVCLCYVNEWSVIAFWVDIIRLTDYI